jgi:hypothetical protein
MVIYSPSLLVVPLVVLILLNSGRSFAIVPRHIAPNGYLDIGKDDYEDGETMDDLQNIMLATPLRLEVKANDQ